MMKRFLLCGLVLLATVVFALPEPEKVPADRPVRVELRSGELAVRVVEGNDIELIDLKRDERLFIVPGAKLLLPSFATNAVLASAVREGESISLTFTDATLTDGCVTIAKRAEEGFLLSGSFTPRRAVEINRLDLCAPGARTTCVAVRNFRHVLHSATMAPEVVLGNAFATDTYSKDWQFAPHPTTMLFTRGDANLFWGATCPPVGGYGLYIHGKRFIFDGFYLDYGQTPNGVQVAAGETWRTPGFRLFLERGGTPYDVHRRFGEILAREGYIPDPSKKKIFAWHRENMACTWGDQYTQVGTLPPPDLKEQSMMDRDGVKPSWRPLTTELVRKEVEVIEREKLPVRTILIDGGWSRNVCDFRAAPERFPHFRELVDELHARGFKVVVWWSWAEVRNAACEAAVGEEHLIGKGKRRDCHGRAVIDFSLKSTQEEYLKPMFRRLFSSEPGCYDLDGIKTDYQADKVHPDMQPSDPAWRGEENYFFHLYQLFFTEMRRWKPDAVHVGCAGNYFLAQFIDVNRTYDINDYSVESHLNRARMLEATAPNVLPVIDIHAFRNGRKELLRQAREKGYPHHLTVLMTGDDMFAPFVPTTEKDFDELRGAKPLDTQD